MDQITLALAKNYTDEQVKKASTGEVLLDKTLSKEGLAAEAKAVGEALDKKQPIGDYALKEEISPEIFAKLEDGTVVPIEVQIDLNDKTSPALVVVSGTAEVGQTVVVKAVDENGKPTMWEAVDLPTCGDEEWKLLVDVTMEADTKNYSHTFVEPQRKLKVIVDSLAAEADTTYSGFQVEFDNGVNGYKPSSGTIYPRPIPAKQAARSIYYVSTYYMDKTPFVDIETFYNVAADRDVSDRRFFCRESLTERYTGNVMIPAIRVFAQNTYGVFAAGTRYRIYGVRA